MGTPEFAVPALDALRRAGHDIVGVFTQPDKPRDRGKKIKFTPVKEYAVEHGLEVFQPLSLKKGEDGAKSFELIKRLCPDVIVVAAYGRILPREILDLPRFGCVNIHASLLPRWRGASPINFCIINGDKETGVTIQQMAEGIDTGDMLLWESCAIGDKMTASELHDELKIIGAKLIVQFAENPEEFIKNKTPQDHSLATYAPLITKEMKEIDWNKSPVEVFNFIRGMSGEAFTFIDNKRLKVFASEVVESAGGAEMVLDILSIVYGDDNLLKLTEVQLEGKNKMNADEFLRGYGNK